MSERIYNPYRNRKREEKMRFLDLLKTLLAGFIISCIVLAVARISVVNGHSMDPNLYDSEKLIVSRISYKIDNPQRGDIVVAEHKDIGVDFIIKRVIGLPGETVEIKNNKIYINDEELDESYIKEPMTGMKDKKWKLGDDEYFICGDNRNDSLDSRDVGPVHKDDIFGKAVFSLSDFTVIK